MTDLKLKDIGGVNGNVANALADGGVITMEDYMGKDQGELLRIKGVGVASLGTLAQSLQAEIKAFRAENTRESQAITIEDGLPDPEPWVDTQPKIATESPRLKSQEPEEIFQQDQQAKALAQEDVLAEPPTQEFIDASNEHQYPTELRSFLVDVNPSKFKNYEEATSFICDWIIASQPYINVPVEGESMQKAFISRWPEHIKVMDNE